ncbi:Regulator of G-protein signaling 6 [Rhizophlyctis rosea]|nr:Regulator of G-protein signaling 6 [Rhizophlyctis rosea]
MTTPKTSALVEGVHSLSIEGNLADDSSVHSTENPPVQRSLSTTSSLTSANKDATRSQVSESTLPDSTSTPDRTPDRTLTRLQQDEGESRASSLSSLFKRNKQKSYSSFTSRSASGFGMDRDDDTMSINSAHSLTATLKEMEEYEKRIEPLLPAGARGEGEGANQGQKSTGAAMDRKVQAMERTVRKMLDPHRGIELQERKKMMKAYKFAFTGQEFVDWTLKYCGFFEKSEGIFYGKTLMTEGYICPIEFDKEFGADSNVYVFQTSQFMPGQPWTATDRDYAIYLLKRDYRMQSKFALNEEEVERAKRLRKQLHKEWKSIDKEAEALFRAEEEMDKSDIRLFRIQEHTFWRILKPVDLTKQSTIQEEKRTKQTRSKQEEFERSLDKWDLEDYLKKQLESLNYSLNISRSKVSKVAESLVNFMEIIRPLDPLLEQKAWAQNPWSNDYSIMMQVDRQEASPTEIRVWTISFAKLLEDPVGFRAFRKFCKSEFSQENLQFWAKCQALDDIDTRAEFYTASASIYQDFIKVGGSKELNLNTLTRKECIARFEAANGEARKLSYDWYIPAMEHVYTLMEKDTYIRFLKTDIVQDALKELRRLERAASASVVGGGPGGKVAGSRMSMESRRELAGAKSQSTLRKEDLPSSRESSSKDLAQ